MGHCHTPYFEDGASNVLINDLATQIGVLKFVFNPKMVLASSFEIYSHLISLLVILCLRENLKKNPHCQMILLSLHDNICKVF